jgi:hypothetical protein
MCRSLRVGPSSSRASTLSSVAGTVAEPPRPAEMLPSPTRSTLSAGSTSASSAAGRVPGRTSSVRNESSGPGSAVSALRGLFAGDRHAQRPRNVRLAAAAEPAGRARGRGRRRAAAAADAEHRQAHRGPGRARRGRRRRRARTGVAPAPAGLSTLGTPEQRRRVLGIERCVWGTSYSSYVLIFCAAGSQRLRGHVSLCKRVLCTRRYPISS